MEIIGSLNHAVSIVGYWIFDSRYKKTLPLTLYSLNIICSPLEVEGIFAMFETVFWAVRYIKKRVKLNISE